MRHKGEPTAGKEKKKHFFFFVSVHPETQAAAVALHKTFIFILSNYTGTDRVMTAEAFHLHTAFDARRPRGAATFPVPLWVGSLYIEFYLSPFFLLSRQQVLTLYSLQPQSCLFSRWAESIDARQETGVKLSARESNDFVLTIKIPNADPIEKTFDADTRKCQIRYRHLDFNFTLPRKIYIYITSHFR